MKESPNMERKAFFVLLLISLAGGLYVISPFLKTIVLGIAFTILFKPLHLKYLHWTRGRSNLSSCLSVISVFFFILIPITVLFTVLTTQITSMVTSLTANLGEPTMSGLLAQLEKKMSYYSTQFELFGFNFDIVPLISKFLENTSVALANYSPRLVEDTLTFFLHLFIMTIVLFYFFREGSAFFKIMLRITPVKDKYELKLANEIRMTIRGVFYGSFVIAIIQAILALIGFYFLRLDNSLVWAVLVFCMSFVPIIGTAAAFVPLILLLLSQGQIHKAIFVSVYAGCVIGLIDNFLRPLLIKNNVHPLVLFLSVFGGLAVFGPTGLLFGPMLLAMLSALLSIYAKDFPEVQSSALTPIKLKDRR
jgi:predicted PurR-regulated permease PerM